MSRRTASVRPKPTRSPNRLSYASKWRALREAVRARDDFVAIAAYELRNPMIPPSGLRKRALAAARSAEGYTANTRHRHAGCIVTNEAAEQIAVRKRRPPNDLRPVTPDDEWANVARR